MTEAINQLVDHLIRHSAGQMVAVLTRVLGPARIDIAEEVVQDALVRALETWSFHGVPADPKGWLFRVARNRALDLLRRESNFSRKSAELALDAASATFGERAHDDELAMIFM